MPPAAIGLAQGEAVVFPVPDNAGRNDLAGWFHDNRPRIGKIGEDLNYGQCNDRSVVRVLGLNCFELMS
jgi:hypothetical protein